MFFQHRLIQSTELVLVDLDDFFRGSSITSKQTEPLKKQLKAVLATENWVGTACVLETATRRG